MSDKLVINDSMIKIKESVEGYLLILFVSACGVGLGLGILFVINWVVTIITGTPFIMRAT